MTPIAKTKLRITGYPIANPKPKRSPPTHNEKIVNLMINLLIYCWRGVNSSSSPAVAAKLAIWPIKVLSPVAKTIPVPVPYLFNVEKNAIFFVSRGLSFVHYGIL